MRLRNLGRLRRIRTLWVALAAFSLVHAPLPQPDFHNIRHHDGPGEVCEYHDHLLRWHPGAGLARDVAVLHWHWFLPSAAGEEPPAESSGPAVHAHTPGWLTATWEDGPRVTADTAVRLAPRPAPCPLEQPLSTLAPALSGLAPPPGIRPPLAFGATFAPGVSAASRLHRWNC
jgi:hypothetical protein